MEIYAVSLLPKINVRVWLPDSSYLTVVVESWTTVNEVEDIIANRTPDPLLQAGDSVYVPQRVF